VAALPQHLRRDVVGRPAQRPFALPFKCNLARQPKVSDFEIVTGGEEEVAELEVAVDDVLRLHVLDRVQQLVHEPPHIL
jgi:hypothetical protein